MQESSRREQREKHHKKSGELGRAFATFLWQNRRSGMLFLLFTGIFALVFSLYDLEVEAVFYAAALCALAGGLFLVAFFFRFWRRHRAYREMLENLPLLPDALPEPETLAERDLTNLLERLQEIREQELTDWRNRQQESEDYYTAWAHQIKTPIAVMGMTLEAEDTEEHRELSAELFRIEQYVEMVLSYLRLGSGSSDYVFRECDLDEILRQAIRKYASQFIRRKIRLVYEPTGRRVLTDEKWLLFIVEQVFSNCVKYAAGGTVAITVAESEVLRIADTGIGIAPEDLPRIFEKGFTGYNGRADKKSTGLGLYLCRMAAGRLGNRIWAESEPGKGTAVCLDLYREPLETE